MIAKGFKPVGWAAAVGAAALGCYMLSLNVAAERAELEKIERQIIAAKQDIRALQTELGTRGRLTQLEHWNAEVLALSAPGSRQFLSNEFKLASFSAPEQSSDQVISNVRLASADQASTPELKPAIETGFEPPVVEPKRPMLRQASLLRPESSPLAEKKPVLIKAAAVRTTQVRSDLAPIKAQPKAAPKEQPTVVAKKPSMLDAGVLAEINSAAKAEKKSGGAAAR